MKAITLSTLIILLFINNVTNNNNFLENTSNKLNSHIPTSIYHIRHFLNGTGIFDNMNITEKCRNGTDLLINYLDRFINDATSLKLNSLSDIGFVAVNALIVKLECKHMLDNFYEALSRFTIYWVSEHYKLSYSDYAEHVVKKHNEIVDLIAKFVKTDVGNAESLNKLGEILNFLYFWNFDPKHQY